MGSGQGGFMAAGDKPEIVDARRWRRRGGRLGRGFGVGVAADLVGHAPAHRSSLEADLDRLEVERVEDHLDAVADEGGVDLEGVAMQADGGDLGHRAGLGPQERLVQQLR